MMLNLAVMAKAMNAPASLPADGFTFPAGVTTVVDAGSPGWKTFELYKFTEQLEVQHARFHFRNLCTDLFRLDDFEHRISGRGFVQNVSASSFPHDASKCSTMKNDSTRTPVNDDSQSRNGFRPVQPRPLFLPPRRMRPTVRAGRKTCATADGRRKETMTRPNILVSSPTNITQHTQYHLLKILDAKLLASLICGSRRKQVRECTGWLSNHMNT